MRVALSSCMGKACCRFCSAWLAPPTKKIVRTGKHGRVLCRHERRRPTLHLGKARSRQPCDRRRAWVVHIQCRANDRGSRRPMLARCPDSCPVPRAVPALVTHQARSQCPCRYARMPCPFTHPARCRPLSRNNTQRSGSAAHHRGISWPRARARIAHVASDLDLARPRQEIRRRSPSRRSVHGEKASVHGRAEIGSLSPKGDMAAWRNVH
jgi:hypothetical protein